MTMTQQQQQRGFTLLELMIVVAIVGVMVTLATATLRTSPTIGSVGNRVASLLREASRVASARGPMRDDVVQDTGETARSRLFLTRTAAGRTLVSIDAAVEDAPATPNTFQWLEVREFAFPEQLTVAGTRPVADVDGGLGGPSVPLVAGAPHTLRCFANASCEAGTVYLESTTSQSEKLRVIVMPLSGAPLILQGW